MTTTEGATGAPEQDWQPELTDLDIMAVIESVCQDDEVVHVLDAHNVAIRIRDHMQAKIEELRATIYSRDKLIGHLSEQLAEVQRLREGGQSFAVEVQPPAHVLEGILMDMEGDYCLDTLRYVVYNDATRDEWLQPAASEWVPVDVVELVSGREVHCDDIGLYIGTGDKLHNALTWPEIGKYRLCRQRRPAAGGD